MLQRLENSEGIERSFVISPTAEGVKNALALLVIRCGFLRALGGFAGRSNAMIVRSAMNSSQTTLYFATERVLVDFACFGGMSEGCVSDIRQKGNRPAAKMELV